MIQTRTLTQTRRLKTPSVLDRLTGPFTSRWLARGPDADQFWLLMIAGSDPDTGALVYDQMQAAQR